MNKEIYLIGGKAAESYTDFRDRMLHLAGETAAACHPAALWVTLTESPPPRFSVIPFKTGRIAAFTLFRPDSDVQEYSMLTGMKGFRSAYRVEEAIPVSYSKTWPDGSITPGVCLLTLFRPRKGLSHEQFIDRWHNSHTPLSLRIHPLWHYNRNVVISTVATNESEWGGIVEEHFKTASDLLNPFRFFGNPLVILPRMIEVYRDTRSFLDYNTIEPWFVRQYHLSMPE